MHTFPICLLFQVRNLKEQLARATQQLEQADVVKGKLRKATTRMEDLEEQLQIKNKIERLIIFDHVYSVGNLNLTLQTTFG